MNLRIQKITLYGFLYFSELYKTQFTYILDTLRGALSPEMQIYDRRKMD